MVEAGMRLYDLAAVASAPAGDLHKTQYDHQGFDTKYPADEDNRC